MKLFDGVGLGTFPFSNVFSQVDERRAENIVRTFLDFKGKYIQTAPYYPGVDEVLFKILKKISREKYFISTLCVKNRKGDREGRYSSIIEQCEDSLTHLGLKYIDLLMTSTTKAEDASLEETISAMVDLQLQGKIRRIGVCNVNLNQLKRYNSTGHVQFVQNRFSLLDRKEDYEFNEYCNVNNIGLIPYNVIERGLLTNKVLKGIELRAGDLRNSKPEFRIDAQRLIGEWVSKYLKPLADQYRVSIEALVIAWTLNQQNVSLCVIGATSPQQVQSCLQATKVRMDNVTMTKIENAYSILEDGIKNSYNQTIQNYLGNAYK